MSDSGSAQPSVGSATTPQAAHPTARKPVVLTPKPVPRRSICAWPFAPVHKFRGLVCAALRAGAYGTLLTSSVRFPFQYVCTRCPADCVNVKSSVLTTSVHGHTRSLEKLVIATFPTTAPPGGKYDRLVTGPSGRVTNSASCGRYHPPLPLGMPLVCPSGRGTTFLWCADNLLPNQTFKVHIDPAGGHSSPDTIHATTLDQANRFPRQCNTDEGSPDFHARHLRRTTCAWRRISWSLGNSQL